MSTTTSSIQYNIEVSSSQPDTGADYGVQISVQQTSSFGDTEAVALYNAQLAAVPTGFSAPISSLSKLTQSMTQANWSASAQAFQ